MWLFKEMNVYVKECLLIRLLIILNSFVNQRFIFITSFCPKICKCYFVSYIVQVCETYTEFLMPFQSLFLHDLDPRSSSSGVLAECPVEAHFLWRTSFRQASSICRTKFSFIICQDTNFGNTRREQGTLT